jgi:YVTN family beta-propeller protein
VAVTWQDTSIALYVDGQQRSGRDDAHPPDVLGATIYVGSASWQGQQADAVLDELRISDVPRIGQSSVVPYRILVADRYNHRLQAFDELGRFVTAFGEHGAGLGQFDEPRGLAATDQGLVVVADSDNDRLQILAFDGFEFTPVREVQAGLSSPTGVALYGQDRIVVADTGNDRIVVLDMDGNLLAGHTGPNDGYTGPFSLPQGVLAECATGDIVVADQGNQRVVRILDALPILANFAATPISGRVPLTVTFTNASCGNYTSSLWDLGDGLTSTMTHAVHTYTQPGVYTVTLTASGPTGSTVETRPAYIRVWAEQGICLPLVLKGEEPPPPTPTPEPGDCYPQQVAAPSVGRTPHGLAVDGAGGRLLVGNHEDDTLSVIDITIYDLLETVSAGDGPNGVAHDPGSDRIYVANRNANTVTVLRGSDYGLVAAVAVGSLPNGVAVDPGGRRVYVANFGSGTLSVIDGDSLDVIDTIPVGAEPSMVTVNQVTGKVYVTLHGEGRVAAIDGAGSVTSVDLQSAGPYGVTVDQVNNHVYVATIDSARIVVVDGSTDTLLGWAEIRRSGGGEPVPLRLVAVDPLLGASGHLFVTTTGEDGGWDRVLMLPKGWNEGFAQPIALELDEPREGIALEAASHRVFVSSRAGDLVAVYLDGEPPCPGNFALAGEYQVSVVPRAGW